MPIGAAALLLFRGGGGIPSQAPIARDDLGIDIAPGEFVDVSVLTNDDLFGEAVTNFEVLAASGVHPEILPGNVLRLWGLTPPPAHTNDYVINVPADPAAILRFPRSEDPGIDIPGTFRKWFLADQDVTVIFDPNTTYTSDGGGFEFFGGRHVRIIGGNFVHNVGGGTHSFTEQSGSIFIEGFYSDLAAVSADAIVTRRNDTAAPVLGTEGSVADVYIQHCMLLNLNGSDSTVHADMYQPQSVILGHLQVEEFTGTTNYQGLQIPLFPNTPSGHSSAIIRWADFALSPPDDRANFVWMKQVSDPNQVYYPVDLYEVYANESTNPTNQPWHVFSFAPNTTSTPEPAVLSGDGLSLTWPNSGGFITGTAKKGPSPFGNFAYRAGLGYVSPWGTP